MARIYLDARNLTAEPSGIGRYALSLIPELVAQSDAHEWIVLRHASYREPIFKAPVKEVFIDQDIGGLDNYVRGNRVLAPIFAEYGKPGLYHDLFHVAPRGVEKTTKMVVTLHDLIWIDHAKAAAKSPIRAKAMWAFGRHAIPDSLRRADHVIAVSQPTATRANAWLDETEHSVIEHGVDDDFFAAPPAADALPAGVPRNGTYVLAVGNSKKYKNLGFLVDAFAAADLDDSVKLVLLGNCAALLPRIERAGLADRTVCPGFVGDEQLRAAIGHASMFVFPSLVEGFGLPVLEAMAMGTVTAVSDLEPMKSIGGGAVLRFDPFQVDSLAETLRVGLGDAALRDALERAGRARAGQFSWERAAQSTLQVYQRVLEN